MFLALCFAFLWHDVVATITTHPQSDCFFYGGRWKHIDGARPAAKSDWTCSDLQFAVHVTADGASAGHVLLPLYLKAPRVRLNVTFRDAYAGNLYENASVTVVGPWFTLGSADDPYVVWVPVPSAALPSVGLSTLTVVSVQKLTTAEPFGAGIGARLLPASTVDFFGLGDAESTFHVTYTPPPIKARATSIRRYIAIGASDTAGYCVDGNFPSTPVLTGWEYVNCGMAYAHVLARDHFYPMALTVLGISGIGVMQNSAAQQSWQMGTVPMPGYFPRAIQSDPSSVWEFAAEVQPDLVTVSLGGNDYNHQKGLMPTNASFTRHYVAFLGELFTKYPTNRTSVVAVCGMGDPLETQADPDNNRCRPCAHVEMAVETFKTAQPQSRLHYIFVPCDGSVVTGTDDIGCDGHKNRIGQAKVAEFLAPRLAEIMDW